MAVHIKDYDKIQQRRLSRKQWQDIESMLKSKSKTIQQISDFYGISRNSIYQMSWRKKWLIKKSDKKKTLFQRIKSIFTK